MGHFLDASQLAEECARLGLEKSEQAILDACDAAAKAIAEKRGDVEILNDASNEPGFGGVCVNFGPLKAGAKCPEDFAHYDSGSDWAEQEEDEDEEWSCDNCGETAQDGSGDCVTCGQEE